MVLSLIDESLKSDRFKVICDQFVENLTATMRKITDQCIESVKQARSNSDLKSDRRVLNCGATQEEDCLCVVADSIGSIYYAENGDHTDVVIDYEEEDVNQAQLQTQLIDAIIKDDGDEKGFKEKIGNPAPPNDQVEDLSEHVKEFFLPVSEFSSHFLAKNIMMGEICPNQNRLIVANKVFDENTKQNGYIISLDPDPPDDYGATLMINESNFNIHLKSTPITFISGYGVLNFLMIDNFKVQEFCANNEALSNAGKLFDKSSLSTQAQGISSELSQAKNHISMEVSINSSYFLATKYATQLNNHKSQRNEKIGYTVWRGGTKFYYGNSDLVVSVGELKELIVDGIILDGFLFLKSHHSCGNFKTEGPSVNGKTFDESLEQEWDSWDDVMINIKASRYVSNVYFIDTDFEEFSLEGILNSVTHSSLHMTTESSNYIAKVKYNQVIGGKAAACKSLGYSFDPGGIFVLARDERCKKILNFHLEGKTDFKRKTKNEEVNSPTWKISLVSQIQKKGKDLKPWKSVRRGWNVFVYEVNRVVLLQAVLAIMDFFFPAFVKTNGVEVQNLDHWDYYVTREKKSALEQNQSQLVCEDDSSYVNTILVVNVSFDVSTDTFKGFTIRPMQVPNVCLASGMQSIEEFHSLVMFSFFYTGTIMISTRTTNINDLADMYGSTKNVWVTRDDVTVQQIKITHGHGKKSTYREVTKREPSMKRNDNLWTSELKESGLYWGVIFDPGGNILLPIVEKCRSTLKCHFEETEFINSRMGSVAS